MPWTYKPRWLAPRLVEAVEFSPVVVLTGARQTGKSTLLRNEAPFMDWPYLTLDDLDVREMAENDPNELAALHDRVVIDEVQKVPKLMSAIKLQVDRNRDRRYVLSGSAHLLLMKAVSESLAGRALYFELMPFTLGEETLRPPPDWLPAGRQPEEISTGVKQKENISNSYLFRGALPPVTFLTKSSQVSTWWEGYIRTYLERDLRDLSQIANLPDFRKAMALLASRTGQLLNAADIARSTRLSQATVGRYINLMETGGLFAKLQPFSRNVSKRVVKSPKIFCLDTGLACGLCGIRSPESIDPSFRGQLFETLAFHHLSVIASVNGGRIFYLRKQGGLEREIDFLLEIDGRILTVEVKASERVGLRDAENMIQLRELLPDWHGGLVIYNGESIQKLRRNIWAVPLIAL